MVNFQIGVIIATSFQRTDLLFSRSLKSVLNQTRLPDFVVIVDDNQNENEFEIITSKVTQLNNPNIFCIRNFKTKNHSGTGAWNSSVEFLETKFESSEESYIAILDDDDEWDKTYLEKCAKQIETREIENPKAVFANLVRLHREFEVQGDVNKDNLTIDSFLIGNPGVQGSNMFFNLKSFLDAGSFDENLRSSTDRDLMIRFLQQSSVDNIAFINETLVFHYAQSEHTVTNNPANKWAGLDSFYSKYLNLFSIEILNKSLERAEKYFAYPNKEQVLRLFDNREKIVLAMSLHNGAQTIRRAVWSVVNQKNVRRKLILVIGNDNSTDDWQQEIKDLPTENIIIINISDGGKSHKVRNAINDYILQNLKNVAYIGRLDVDDELADDFVISKLEQIINKNSPDVILAGNYQRQSNKIVGMNIPDKNLLNENYLLERLQKMSLGNFDAELSSCNIFVKPDCLIQYPEKESAEDHWFTVKLLLKSDKLKIHIAENLLYCVYSLDGFVTKSSKKNDCYLQSRIELFEYYRRYKALTLLQSYQNGTYRYLGEGKEGIVFTDNKKVYKVYFSLSEQQLLNLKAAIPLLCNAVHLYEIKDIVNFQGYSILICPFEESKPITELREDDFIGFLAEMWQRKLIHRNIKPENFICVNGIIKLIDYELEQYTDNLFLNICVRAFIHIKYFSKNNLFINKLARSAINNFDLPELAGIQDFVDKIFSTIIFNESQSAFQTLKNVDIKNITTKPFRKTVSLIIKTCPQDYETIYANVKHIVKQLSTPDTFLEKIITIDTKEKDFTREYTNKGTLENLMQEINRLIEEHIVDKYVTLPQNEISEVNKRWFNIRTNETHNVKGNPITPQLYAFEQAKGEYIFQMDSDVMIARKDLSHSFLEDMVSEMEQNEKVVSVGFNICQKVDYKPYFGFENGGFVPEVRMGLFHKQRFFALRPLPNSINNAGKLQLSWYRAMEQKQKETGFCSIRGGDSRSFFIHPQNYRKTNPDVWTTILDRVESGHIPYCQQNESDCAGSYYDWTIPKRNEKLVVVCSVQNVTREQFLRMFCSVASQTYNEWGMIIIDDVSDNGLPDFIDNTIKPYLQKITFIKNRIRQGQTANIYKAIHYFVSNPETVIITINGNGAIIGSTVFEKVVQKYEIDNADVVIGRVYEKNCLSANYQYPANFIQPREKNSNVWKPLRSFKKYLFDSLEITDLKTNNQNQSMIKKALSNQWLPECTDYAIMIPVIEMCKNPMQMDYFAYYQENTNENKCNIDCILNKKAKNPTCVFKGRKCFLPNLNKIEIDITYDCNLKCVACNRSCSQVPTKERMELSDIQNFVNESIEQNKKWEFINILGGEPTLHPDFETVIKCISEEYILSHSPNTVLQIVSNGLTKETQELLGKVKHLPNVSIDYNSFKTNNKIEYFTPFNDAPIDDNNFKDADYTKACWVTSYCGIGLNKFGYYGCSTCGGIDRILNENRGGIKHLKNISTEQFQNLFLKFCPLCGNFKDYSSNNGNFIPRCEKAPLKENIVSESWKKLYDRQNKN